MRTVLARRNRTAVDTFPAIEYSSSDGSYFPQRSDTHGRAEEAARQRGRASGRAAARIGRGVRRGGRHRRESQRERLVHLDDAAGAGRVRAQGPRSGRTERGVAGTEDGGGGGGGGGASNVSRGFRGRRPTAGVAT